MEIIDSICDRLGLDELGKIKYLRDISQKLKAKPSHLGLVAITLLSLLVIFECGSSAISFGIGFIYPAYMSFKAIESTQSLEGDKFWLTYWIVFGILNMFDDVISRILSFLPLYNAIKILFYIWLFHPQTEGANIVYRAVVRGVFAKYQKLE